MKIVVQKMTGLEETTVIEGDTFDDLTTAYAQMDLRLGATNRKIVEVRDFLAQVKDPNYRYLFTAFLDSFLGVSSNAESLLKKFGITAPVDFDKWLAGKDTGNAKPSHLHPVK